MLVILILLAEPQPYALIEEVALPTGSGGVYQLQKVDSQTVLVGSPTTKALINSTKRTVLRVWNDPDTYSKQQVFTSINTNHGQDFSFSCFLQSGKRNVQYLWGSISQVTGSAAPGLIKKIHQFDLYSSQFIAGSYTFAYTLNDFDMSVLGNWVILSSATETNIFARSSLTSGATPFLNFQIGVGYLKVRMCCNAANCFVAGQTLLAVEFGSVTITGTFTTGTLSYSTPGKLLKIKQGCEGIYVANGNNLAFITFGNLIQFDIDIGFTALSLEVMKYQTASHNYLVVGDVDRIVTLRNCDGQCTTCTGPLPYQCTYCTTVFVIVNNSCAFFGCGDSEYYDIPWCYPCTGNGYTCVFRNGAQFITQCNIGFFYFKATCLANCPNHYRQDTARNVCEWVDCAAGTYFSVQTSSCMSCTSATMFIDSTTGNCQYCTLPCPCRKNSLGQIECMSCYPGYYLYDGNCYTQCPLNTESHEASKTCVSCVLYYQFDLKRCVNQCSVGYYPSAGSICFECNQPCLFCTAVHYCLTCANALGQNGLCVQQCTPPLAPIAGECIVCPTYYSSRLQQCVSTCPVNQYLATTVCLPCESSCLSCSGPTAADCTACYFSTYMNAGQCVSTCPSTFYNDNPTLTCRRCAANCVWCVNASFCSYCQTPLLLHQGLCATACPPSHFSNTTHCLDSEQYSVKMTIEEVSYWQQPYSDLRVRLTFSSAVSLATVSAQLLVHTSPGAKFAGLVQISPRQFVLSIAPSNKQRILLKGNVLVVFTDLGYLAQRNYIFSRQAFTSRQFILNYMPTLSEAANSITLALSNSTEKVYSVTYFARSALAPLVFDSAAALVLSSKIVLSKQQLSLHNLLLLGSWPKMKYWNQGQVSSSSGRILLQDTFDSKQYIMNRVVQYGYILFILLVLMAIQIAKKLQLCPKDSVGIHWALSDSIHRSVLQLLFLDLGQGQGAGLAVPLVAICYVEVYFLWRLRRFLLACRTRLSSQEHSSRFKEFQLQFMLFKYRVPCRKAPVSIFQMARQVVFTIAVQLYPYFSMLLYCLKATFVLNLDIPVAQAAVLLLGTAIQGLVLLRWQPYYLGKFNLMAGAVIAIELLLAFGWLFDSVIFKYIPQSLKCAVAFEVIGWLSATLIVFRLIVTVCCQIFVLIEYFKFKIGEFIQRVKIQCQKQIAQKPDKLVHKFLNQLIVYGDLNNARIQTLTQQFFPNLIISISDKQFRLTKIVQLQMNKRHKFMDMNNIKIKQVKQSTIMRNKEPELQSLVTILKNRFSLQYKKMTIQIIYQVIVNQQDYDFGQIINIADEYNQVACRFITQEGSRRFNFKVQPEKGKIYKSIFNIASKLLS